MKLGTKPLGVQPALVGDDAPQVRTRSGGTAVEKALKECQFFRRLKHEAIVSLRPPRHDPCRPHGEP